MLEKLEQNFYRRYFLGVKRKEIILENGSVVFLEENYLMFLFFKKIYLIKYMFKIKI